MGLFGARPMAVLVTARPPADRYATDRALSRSTRAGLPWLVVTTEVTDLRDGPDTLCLAIVQAWDRHRGVAA